MTSSDLMAKWQRKTLLMCWFAYACAYLVRTNVSIALPGLTSAFRLSNAAAGLIGSVFFWCYAAGQLINGFIGDKLNTRYFVFMGLSASALINLAVGCSSSYIAVLILWGVNGFFLSTLWGPLVRVVSVWFPGEKRTGASVILSLSMIGGYFVSWGGGGLLTSDYSWRYAFVVPAVVVLAYAFLWLFKIRCHPGLVGLGLPSAEAGPGKDGVTGDAPGFGAMLVENRIWLIAASCVVLGFVKEGVLLWAPTFLHHTQRMAPALIAELSVAIPMMSLLGIPFSGLLNKLFHYREKRAAAVLFSGAMLSCACLLLFWHVSVFVAVLLLSLIVAFLFGANTLLLTVVPLSFTGCKKVSTVAGMLDFCSYIGAACTGVFTGALIDGAGWAWVFACWAGLALLGTVSMLFASSKARRRCADAAQQAG